MTPNDLANAMTLMPPGCLVAALEQSSPEEREAVEAILGRAQVVREIQHHAARGWLSARRPRDGEGAEVFCGRCGGQGPDPETGVCRECEGR